MLWKSLKNALWGQDAYQTYWYAFLICLPIGWRKVIIPNVLGASFNEYLDFSLYIGDILILFTLLLILYHNLYVLSIVYKMFHVEHVLLISYLTISLAWSSNLILWIDGILSIFRIFSVSIITLVLFKGIQSRINCSTWNNSQTKTAIFSCSTWNILTVSLLILLISAIFQSSLGILQVSENSSIGLKLINESTISAEAPGVAKIIIDGERHIRAYGTFLHPNLLAGYLSIVILLYSLFRRLSMFHVEQSCKISIVRFKLFHVEHYYWFIQSVLHAGLILTASKTAMFTIALFHLIMFHVEHRQVNSAKKLFHVEHFLFVLLILSIAMFWSLQGNSLFTHPALERVKLMQEHIRTLNILFGNGIDQSVYCLANGSPYLEPWQIQPIHSIYLQTFESIGLVGLCLVLLILYKYVPRGTIQVKMLTNVPRGTFIVASLPLLFILTVGMFDHYPLDIYIGNVLFGISIGTVASVYRLTLC